MEEKYLNARRYLKTSWEVYTDWSETDCSTWYEKFVYPFLGIAAIILLLSLPACATLENGNGNIGSGPACTHDCGYILVNGKKVPL